MRFGTEAQDKLWNIRYKLNGIEQSDNLWIIARSSTIANSRAIKVAKQRNPDARVFVTGIKQEGWVDYL